MCECTMFMPICCDSTHGLECSRGCSFYRSRIMRKVPPDHFANRISLHNSQSHPTDCVFPVLTVRRFLTGIQRLQSLITLAYFIVNIRNSRHVDASHKSVLWIVTEVAEIPFQALAVRLQHRLNTSTEFAFTGAA